MAGIDAADYWNEPIMTPDPFRTNADRARTLSELAEVLHRIRTELLAARNAGGVLHRSASCDAKSTVVVAEMLLRERIARKDLPNGDVFVDPVWHIILDLFVQRAMGRIVSVSSACIAAGVPETTALRHLASLEQRGMIRRMDDPKDRRRSFVTLSETSVKQVEDHLSSTNWRQR